MHDRFAINEIEPLNLKTRVREIERDEEREREIIDLLGLFFQNAEIDASLFSTALRSALEKQQIWKRGKKSLFGREMVNLGNTIRFLQHLGDYQS